MQTYISWTDTFLCKYCCKWSMAFVINLSLACCEVKTLFSGLVSGLLLIIATDTGINLYQSWKEIFVETIRIWMRAKRLFNWYHDILTHPPSWKETFKGCQKKKIGEVLKVLAQPTTIKSAVLNWTAPKSLSRVLKTKLPRNCANESQPNHGCKLHWVLG